MKKLMDKKIVIGVIVVLVIIGGAFFISSGSRNPISPGPSPSPQPSPIPQGATVITITESGFTPRDITVEKGTTVYFVNEGTNDHWPASAVHPSHQEYPNSAIEKCDTPEEESIFDSCSGIQPGNSWSFTFQEIGTWRYHDHLLPTPAMTGTITVVEKEITPLSDEEALAIARQEGFTALDLGVARAGTRIEVYSCSLNKIVEIDPIAKKALNIRDVAWPCFEPVIEDQGKLNVWRSPEVQALVQRYGADKVHIKALDIDYVQDIEFLKKLHPRFREETGCIIVVHGGEEGYVYQEDKDLNIIYKETFKEFLEATKETDREVLAKFYLSLH